MGNLDLRVLTVARAARATTRGDDVQSSHSLSGIFLLPLGFPWFLIGNAFNESVRPWIAALAPLASPPIIKWLTSRTAAKA